MIPGTEIGLKQIKYYFNYHWYALKGSFEKKSQEIAVQYIDHNLLKRIIKIWMIIFAVGGTFGFWFRDLETELATWYMERFGRPGKTLLGSDSHTPGGIGMHYRNGWLRCHTLTVLWK
jgi:aconitate hydratase